jgi:L-ascorbate metabolism protein UlaG (beta-lactamase superfamily)
VQITHYGHACLLIEIDGVRVLIDPGTFSEGFSNLTDVDAVLITHQHFDHFDAATIGHLMERNPDVSLVVEDGTLAVVPEFIANDRVQRVWPGDRFDVNGLDIEVVGGTHATIHGDIDLVPNVGYFFNGTGLLHPGDEFTPPAADVEILALPISGPWQKLSDAVDYLRVVNPALTFPIHEAVTSRPELFHKYLQVLKPTSTDFLVLEPGLATDLRP